MIRRNTLLTKFLSCVFSGTMHRYDMPIPYHLHGTWLLHIGVMPHNLGKFSLFSLFCYLYFPGLKLWHWVLPILCYQPLLRNTGTFLSLPGQIFPDLFSFGTSSSGSIYWWYAPYFGGIYWYGWSSDLIGVLWCNRCIAVSTYHGM